MFGKIGLPEIAIVFGLALLIFGPAKLPEIGKSFGRGLKEFKSASKEITESIIEANSEEKNN